MSCLAGVEIGGTKIQVVVGTTEGEIQAARSFAVVRDEGADGIRKQISQGLSELRTLHDFSAIGVGFGGPIDWQTGRVFKSHHISGWNGFELGRWLSDTFKVTVKTDNDANVAALAEAARGGGKGKNPVFYMTVGSGIGGGIVRDGSIYHGQYPGEVEIGHTRIPFPDRPMADWPILETLCSGWSLDRQIQSAIHDHPDSMLSQLAQTKETGKEARFLKEARSKGDPVAARIWHDLTIHLGLALSHIIHLFHPQVLILGGGVSELGEPLVQEIRNVLKVLVMEVYQGTYEVNLSQLGQKAVPMGALLLVTNKS